MICWTLLIAPSGSAAASAVAGVLAGSARGMSFPPGSLAGYQTVSGTTYVWLQTDEPTTDALETLCAGSSWRIVSGWKAASLAELAQCPAIITGYLASRAGA